MGRVSAVRRGDASCAECDGARVDLARQQIRYADTGGQQGPRSSHHTAQDRLPGDRQAGGGGGQGEAMSDEVANKEPRWN